MRPAKTEVIDILVKKPAAQGGKPTITLKPSRAPRVGRLPKDKIEWHCADAPFSIVFQRDEEDAIAAAKLSNDPKGRRFAFTQRALAGGRGECVRTSVRRDGVTGTYKYAIVVYTAGGLHIKDPDIIVEDEPPGPEPK